MMKPVARDPAFLAMLGVATDAEIGRQYGLSRERIRQLRIRLGIDRPPKANILLRAKAQATSGLTGVELAAKVGCSSGTALKGMYAAGFIPARIAAVVVLDERIRTTMDQHPDWGDYRIAVAVNCVPHSVRRRRVRWNRPSGHKSNNPRYRS